MADDKSVTETTDDKTEVEEEVSEETLETTDDDKAIEEALSEDEETEEEAEAAEKTEELTEVEESEETKEEAEPEETELSDKELAAQAFKQRQEERQSREEQSSREQQAYLDEAEDERDLALRQLQVEAYNTRVENATSKLVNGFERAKSTIDLYQDPTPEVQTALNDAIDEFEARFVTYDRLGNPTAVKGDIYQFLNKKADSIRQLTQLGSRKEKVASAKSSAATIAPPAQTPKEGKVDPIMAELEAD